MVEQVNVDKILDIVVKLLKLAGNNPNAEEAASAAAKAQEIMTKYNLDMGAIERKSGAKDEKRDKEAVKGGFYKYNRDLYAAVAALNFCMHWVTEEYIEITDPDTNELRNKWRRLGKPASFKALRKVHKLVGRRVNVAATKVMASYLEQAVERILRDWMIEYGYDNTMLFSKKAMSFREGAVGNLVDRIQEERDRAERERRKKAKAEATRSAHPGAAPSTSTALALVDYTESERIANYDARHGEGAWARTLAYDAEWEKKCAEWSRKEAMEDADDEEARACLAIFHPKLFAKLVKEEEKEAERERKRAERERYRSGPREKEVDWEAHEAGSERARDISLNQQVSHNSSKRLK